MCHYVGYFFGGCSRILGIIFWLFPDVWESFFIKFDLFKNNPEFGVLILILPSMTLGNVAHSALVSYFLCRNVQ